MTKDKPLRKIIEKTSPGNVIFRTDFPQYNAEFVGNVLTKLVEDLLANSTRSFTLVTRSTVSSSTARRLRNITTWQVMRFVESGMTRMTRAKRILVTMSMY